MSSNAKSSDSKSSNGMSPKPFLPLEKCLPTDLLRLIFSFIAIDSPLFVFEDLTWFEKLEYMEKEKIDYIDLCLQENFEKTNKTLVSFLVCKKVSTEDIRKKYLENIHVTDRNRHLICEENIFTKSKIPEREIENILRNDLFFFQLLVLKYKCKIDYNILLLSVINIEAMIFVSRFIKPESRLSFIVLEKLYEKEKEKIFPTLEWLMSQGVELYCGCTLFAVEKDDFALLNFLFRNGCNIEMTCLEQATRRNNFKTVKFLVEECKEQQGSFCTFYATRNNNLDMLCYFKQKFGKIDWHDLSLEHAIKNKNTKMVEYIRFNAL